jgi:hypothetical protein
MFNHHVLAYYRHLFWTVRTWDELQALYYIRNS